MTEAKVKPKYIAIAKVKPKSALLNSVIDETTPKPANNPCRIESSLVEQA
jgi:hypothetical protein